MPSEGRMPHQSKLQLPQPSTDKSSSRLAYRNNQFNEDIKYLVFDEKDKEKMSPEEYERSREVLKEQEDERKEYLKKKAEQRR